ncbi:hypothetical protein [Hymenobacter sp. BRD128]|uniref:hypothetical protein n=1 Tax=Hymenobacter sp. BRD128 TaxID=2675878 RepID=UPI00349F0EA5
MYKLAALRTAEGQGWDFTIKLSEQQAKTSIPGILQVRRYLGEASQPRADMIYNVAAAQPLPAAPILLDPADATRRRPVRPGAPYVDLLAPVLRQGRLVQPLPTLAESRAHARQQVASLDASIRRYLNPHVYPVGLEQGLHEFRTQLMLEKRPVRPA